MTSSYCIRDQVLYPFLLDLTPALAVFLPVSMSVLTASMTRRLSKVTKLIRVLTSLAGRELYIRCSPLPLLSLYFSRPRYSTDFKTPKERVPKPGPKKY